jgi:hypothetical protein
MKNLTPKQRAYLLIGDIATSWSEVEALWYLIFTLVMKDTPRKITDAIYFQTDYGPHQRALILAAAEAAYPPDRKTKRPHPTRKKIGQLNAATEKLVGKRNQSMPA